MNRTHAALSSRTGRKIGTETISERFEVQPQTPRRSYCLHGHWMGMVPTKLPNGRLLWDEDEADRLLVGEPVKADAAAIEAHFARKAAKPPKLPEHIARKVAAKRLKVPTDTVQAVTTSEVA